MKDNLDLMSAWRAFSLLWIFLSIGCGRSQDSSTRDSRERAFSFREVLTRNVDLCKPARVEERESLYETISHADDDPVSGLMPLLGDDDEKLRRLTLYCLINICDHRTLDLLADAYLNDMEEANRILALSGLATKLSRKNLDFLSKPQSVATKCQEELEKVTEGNYTDALKVASAFPPHKATVKLIVEYFSLTKEVPWEDHHNSHFEFYRKCADFLVSYQDIRLIAILSNQYSSGKVHPLAEWKYDYFARMDHRMATRRIISEGLQENDTYMLEAAINSVGNLSSRAFKTNHKKIVAMLTHPQLRIRNHVMLVLFPKVMKMDDRIVLEEWWRVYRKSWDIYGKGAFTYNARWYPMHGQAIPVHAKPSGDIFWSELVIRLSEKYIAEKFGKNKTRSMPGKEYYPMRRRLRDEIRAILKKEGMAALYLKGYRPGLTIKKVRKDDK